MIRFNNVTKHFVGVKHPALEDITIDIGDGEFVFLIGPSGAGKSTVLRLILRDLLPTSGTVIVNEWETGKIPSGKIHLLRRSIGMVFQDFKLLSDRTIGENIAVGVEILGKPRLEIEKRVNEVLDLVDLPDKANYFPLQLSAGELQRVSIARAIAAGPAILLADEPTGNLDPETGWGIMQILKEINAMGTTIVMATHNDSFVNQMKKRTITMKDGKIHRDEEKGRYHLVKHEHNAHEHVKHDGEKETTEKNVKDGKKEDQHGRD